MVKVKVYGPLKKYTAGKSSIQIRISDKGNTLGSIINQIFGEEEKIIKDIAGILVNGKNSSLTGGMNTGIKNDDEISIFPYIAGG